MHPNGGEVEFRSDGTGVAVRYAGFGGYSVTFEWKADGASRIQVRALSRDYGEELDPEFLEWHPSTYQVAMAIHYGSERPAIEFDGFGVLWAVTFDLAYSEWPLAYIGPPTQRSEQN